MAILSSCLAPITLIRRIRLASYPTAARLSISSKTYRATRNLAEDRERRGNRGGSACGMLSSAPHARPFFLWLESTTFSVWMRESPSIFAFPMILAVHTIGLGLIAGINAAQDLRLLGFARGIPVRELRRFLPVMWLGLIMNVLSGIALLIAYPTKALTNPVFYLKLGLIAGALVILRKTARFMRTEE